MQSLADVLDELTAAATPDACVRITVQAASELAGADGLCLLSVDGDSCVVALADQQQSYRCDLHTSSFCRASLPRPEAAGSRMLWDKEDFIALPTGERRRIGAMLLVPVRATSGYSAVGFFWQPGQPADPQATRALELLAKALGLVTSAWRKDEEHTARQRHQQRIAADLQHRLRNNLALMRSIIRRSHESAESAEHFALHLEARIAAVSRMQGAFAAGVELEDLVRTELIASAVPEQRYLVQGPAVRLHAKGAAAVGLAVHELATNSVKFGALGAASGSLTVTWTMNRDSRPRLRISWVEGGANIVSVAPRRRGFGQELIECTLPYELGAHTRLSFSPGGVLCEIELPLEACATAIEPATQPMARGASR
jgi:two-component sensor histidine kinase